MASASSNTTSTRTLLLVLGGITLLSVLFRTVPGLHIWNNFSPVGALALFSGALLWNKKWMFVFPIAAMLISDTIKEIVAPGTGFYADISYVYASFFVILFLGMLIRNNKRPVAIFGASVLGSVLFFLITNFGAWMSNSGTSLILYTHDINGLMKCYGEGLPFFKGTLSSDLLFNAIFFGGYYLFAQNKAELSTVKN